MSIKYLIQRYPVTITFVFFLISSMSTLVWIGKTYATDTKNTEGCGCNNKRDCRESDCIPSCKQLSDCPYCSCVECGLYYRERNAGICPMKIVENAGQEIEKCADRCDCDLQGKG